ncbi:TolC family protein, partial [Clostridium neonatale]
YNAIILKEIEIENLKKSFEIKNNELYYLKAKVQIGKAKSNDLEDKEIEVKSLKDSITAKENSLSINKEYFGVLTNLNTSNCIFDRSVNYNKFKIDGSIDNYIDEKLDEYLHYNEEILNLTEDTFNEVKDDGVDDILDEDPPSVPDKAKYVSTETDENGKPTASFNYGGYALGMMEYQSKIESYIKHLQRYESYLDGKYSIDEGKVKLEDSKKKLKNGLKESYAALLDLENTIDNLSNTVNSTNKKLEFAKASVENGLMTENDYNSKVLSAKDLESNLRKLVNTHDKLKNNIEKPWTLSSN